MKVIINDNRQLFEDISYGTVIKIDKKYWLKGRDRDNDDVLINLDNGEVEKFDDYGFNFKNDYFEVFEDVALVKYFDN